MVTFFKLLQLASALHILKWEDSRLPRRLPSTFRRFEVSWRLNIQGQSVTEIYSLTLNSTVFDCLVLNMKCDLSKRRQRRQLFLERRRSTVTGQATRTASLSHNGQSLEAKGER